MISAPTEALFFQPESPRRFAALPPLTRGAVCAFYRIIFQNVSKEDAIHEMTEGGYGFHRIYKNIIRRIKEANVEQIRKEVMEGGEL